MASSRRLPPLRSFPNLNINNHVVTSPANLRYNCIAWAAGDVARWWWPDRYGYWPAPVPRIETIAAFVLAFGTLGYETCEEGESAPEREKIAIFALEGSPTHAARQLDNGRRTSKLGEGEDIEHDLNALDGPVYGAVVCFLQRFPRERVLSTHPPSEEIGA